MNTEWRLPTKDELFSIVNRNILFSAKTFLPGVKYHGGYWSSNEYGNYTPGTSRGGMAYGVGFHLGCTYYNYKDILSNVRYVRDSSSNEHIFSSLRGSPDRFLERQDCYFDRSTGLEWAKQDALYTMTWHEASGHIENPAEDLGIVNNVLDSIIVIPRVRRRR